MGEFNKNQDDQTGQQGDKPAFGQLDKEQGQQDQQEIGQKGEALTGEKQQGDAEMTAEKGTGEDQAR